MPDFRERGFAVSGLTLSPDQCDHIALSVPLVAPGRGGVRGLIEHPTVLQLLRHRQFGEYLWSVVGRELVAVRALLFDKTAGSSWRATWHQDRKIAVRERMRVEGFTSWSTKSGVVHVEPPVHVLEQMIALRVHLDECGPDNGPLRVIPGSHELGKIAEEDIERIVSAGEQVELCVAKGAIVVMRPLLLHASPPARVPGHRRVVHIELAPAEAISPLIWDQAVRVRAA
ncbi:MAG TPA: phytanoyl-CoA dioxygenase family protein [Thermoanaerobaculia bacterium]|nr:phytanoyl-CoA dioxygenase family protein [Thermoanaerobaculia bacterium]